jgi:RNA polymerase-binding protein DksA
MSLRHENRHRRHREAVLERLLEDRRREVAAALHGFRDTVLAESPAGKDLEDHAVEELTRGMEFALAEMKAATLQRIDEAIRRLHNGAYGICTDCGADISEARLAALPFASLCRYCQAEWETTAHTAHPLESEQGSRPHQI